MTIQSVTNPNRSRSWRFGWILIPLVIACLTLPRAINAADGGLAGGNTAEGDNALNSLTSGTGNTAIGNRALFSDANGNDNTASGPLCALSQYNRHQKHGQWRASAF